MEKKQTFNRDAEKRIFPVMEEKLKVEKHAVETGATRVTIKVRDVEEIIEQHLETQAVEIKHVPVGRFIGEPIAARTEGDVTIIPILEEVLVVEKKLRLKEEVHVRRLTTTEPYRHKEVVRKEEAVVEHVDRKSQLPAGDL